MISPKVAINTLMTFLIDKISPVVDANNLSISFNSNTRGGHIKVKSGQKTVSLVINAVSNNSQAVYREANNKHDVSVFVLFGPVEYSNYVRIIRKVNNPGVVFSIQADENNADFKRHAKSISEQISKELTSRIDEIITESDDDLAQFRKMLEERLSRRNLNF